MLDDLYQADTDAAIADLIKRPPAPQPQATKFSAWKALTAIPRGAAAGALETAAMVPEVADAIGGAFTRAASSMLPTPRAGGRAPVEPFTGASTPEGDYIRQESKAFMPDPATAHGAEQAVFGFSKFATKAVGSVAVAGPVGGAAAVGVNEGLTAADDLKQQGVDLGTRSAVGAVSGLAGAAGVILPVAGKTAVQTAALVAVGGPGAFMAQQAATRDILQSADYSKLADQYDPLDPVGLAISTLVPAGFGAWAMRGVKARAKGETVPPEAKPPAEPAGRAPDAQPAPEAPKPEPTRPTPEHVDAARVEMLTQHIEAAGLHSAADARAAAMHLDAFARALDDLSAGRRVDVTDLVPVERMQTARALDTFAQGLETARADLVAQAAQRAEPGAVRAMQSELVDAQAKLAELEDPAAMKARAGDLQQSERLSFKQAMAQARREFDAQAQDVRARVSRIETMLEDNATATRAVDALGRLDQQRTTAQAQRAQIDAPATRQTPTAAAAKEAANVQDAPPTRASQPGQPSAEPSAAPAQPAPADARSPGPAGAGEQGGGGVSRAGGDAAEAAVVGQRLAEIQQQFPDLTVQMDGMPEPMKLSDFLAEVQREAMEGTDDALGGNDASLMQVAASCFLLNGA